MGTPAAAVPSLERILHDGHQVAALYTQPDRPSGRGNKVAASPVKQFGLDKRLPVFQPVKIRTDDALDIFSSHKADVAVVVAYGRILPDAFLTAFPKGAINVHFSLLPKYRGAAPVNWAIARGESETGVTTMRMDAGLDTGDVLLQRRAMIDPQETSIELMSRLSSLGAELLAATLNELGTLVASPQAHELATLAPILKKQDGLIDWQLSAGEIANRVRGFQPFPGVYTHFEQKKLNVWRASQSDTATESDLIPGRVIVAGGDGLLVACGGGSVLRIDELQPEGKRRLAVRDFLNGFQLREGDTLGA